MVYTQYHPYPKVYDAVPAGISFVLDQFSRENVLVLPAGYDCGKISINFDNREKALKAGLTTRG